MRTTVAIEDQVLEEVRRLAARRGDPMGVVVSELLRAALTPRTPAADATGLPLMPVQPGAGRATLELVNGLRDELP